MVTGVSTTLQHSQHPKTIITPNQQHWMACAQWSSRAYETVWISHYGWLPLDTLRSIWGINLSSIPFKRFIHPLTQNFLWSRLWTNPQENLKREVQSKQPTMCTTGCTISYPEIQIIRLHWICCTQLSRPQHYDQTKLFFSIRSEVHPFYPLVGWNATWEQWRQRVFWILIETIRILRPAEFP